tara:strand:+ start:997 stop:1143 length:147 start_codon:yes stop_codon:yes gene_type:complete
LEKSPAKERKNRERKEVDKKSSGLGKIKEWGKMSEKHIKRDFCMEFAV